MNTQELAKIIVEKYNLPRAEKYNLSMREFDNMIEVIGYISDPNYDVEEMDLLKLDTPMIWVTLGVIPANAKVNI